MTTSTLGQMKLSVLSKILTFSAIVEICTGLFRCGSVDGRVMVAGGDDSSEALTADSRLFGIALIAHAGPAELRAAHRHLLGCCSTTR
jgi:hypothetical protein